MSTARQRYPEWVAMGAAIVGTLLGGLAVFMALRGPDLALAGALTTPVAAATATTESTPPAAAARQPAASVPAAPEPASLADVIERTMGSVVSVRLGGQVRGAGVIYDEGGLILTNYHVVESVLRRSTQARIEADTEGVTAQFINGRELEARVVAADADEDIAVLKLSSADDAERFVPALIGESGTLRVGDDVFAIGSPVGLHHTVSTGIVSALDRTDILPKRQLALLQLDASINVGNSGGPLFDRRGRLVGITVARSRGAQGIGFAIPIDHVSAVLRALQKGEAQRSGVIGIELTTRDVAEALRGLDYATGLFVAEVYEGPARQAGIREGDVVVEIRGKRYDQLGVDPSGREAFLRHFGQVVRSVIPGEALDLTVVRDGNVRRVQVQVAAADESRQARIDCEEILGLHLAEDSETPIVDRLGRGSAVAMLGGTDVLLAAEVTHVMGHRVSSVTELGKAVAEIRAWARSGRGRTISVGFRGKQGGDFTVPAFPLNVGS